MPTGTGVFVQARMTSERLPGKVLAEVAGRPLLGYLLERLDHGRRAAPVVVLTSDQPSDDPIEVFCRKSGVECFRGDLLNVARRFLDALEWFGWDSFVRISGDSPMLDQALVAQAIGIFRQGRFDLVTNVMPRSWPPGESVEVIRSEVFSRSMPLMDQPNHLEHVTPYFYENKHKFRIFNLFSESQLTEVRLSVDTKADLDVFARIARRMTKPHWQYGLAEIVDLYRQAVPAGSAAPA
jgi:spore coat polysaccharide biosynthesis protein SpsF